MSAQFAATQHADVWWLAFLFGALLTLVGGARIVWHHGEVRLRKALSAADGHCCWACAVMADEDGPLTDEVMDPIGDIFADEIRPVNPPRPPSVWSRLDPPPSNRGRRFDDRSRASNERVARWLTDEQQERIVSQAGPQVVAEAEAILKFWQSARDRGETTGEIRRGEPGE